MLKTKLKTKKSNKFMVFCLLAITVMAIALAVLMPVSISAYAAGQEENADVKTETAQPRLFTNLLFEMGGGNGEVWISATNTFTLFPSTVQVRIYLYSSVAYSDNYADMEFESTTSTGDLDMGNTLKVSASTNGEQKYWYGRMRYKIDNATWEEKTLGPNLCKSSGDIV